MLVRQAWDAHNKTIRSIPTSERVYNPTGQSVVNQKPVTAITLARYCQRRPQASCRLADTASLTTVLWSVRRAVVQFHRAVVQLHRAVVQVTVPRANPPATSKPRPLLCHQVPSESTGPLCGNRPLTVATDPSCGSRSPHCVVGPTLWHHSLHHIHHDNTHHSRDKLVTKRQDHHPCQLFTPELQGSISASHNQSSQDSATPSQQQSPRCQ